MAGLRRYVALSDHWSAKVAKRSYRVITAFTLPAPRLITWPMLHSFLLMRGVYYFLVRIFVCEPLFKAYCTRHGKRIRTGVYVHWVQGKGELIIGDDVLVDGKCSFSFAARYSDKPSLSIGNHTIISHDCSFTVGKRITIGNNCGLSKGVWMFDTSGHPTDPKQAVAGVPAPIDKVRPIEIEDNVWIATGAVICPGVRVGQNSVVAAHSVVTKDVEPNSLVAGNPARFIRSIGSQQLSDRREQPVGAS